MNISLAKNDLISALQIVSKRSLHQTADADPSGIYMTAKEGQLELQTTNYSSLYPHHPCRDPQYGHSSAARKVSY